MPESFIEGFEALDEVGDLASGVGSTRFGAEVGATTEGTVLVAGTASLWSKQGAGAIGMGFQGLATRGADAFRRVEGLGFRDQRGFAGEPEMTAAGPARAIAMQRSPLESDVDRTQFGESFGI